MDDHFTILGPDVSRETIDNLKLFSALLEKWTRSINLIAPKSVPDIWERHILDSAQLFCLASKSWHSWTDLGSGGGLPAIVVAIMDVQQRPITLVESDQRKCLFLNTVRRELGLNLKVVHSRIESADLSRSTILSARALAPLSDLLGYATDILDPDGVALFAKGETYQNELDRAKENWHFDFVAHQSQTHPRAQILEISRIKQREI